MPQQLADRPEDPDWLRYQAANELARGNIANAIERSRYLLDIDPYDEVAKKIEADALAKARELLETETDEAEMEEIEADKQSTVDDDANDPSIDTPSE